MSHMSVEWLREQVREAEHELREAHRARDAAARNFVEEALAPRRRAERDIDRLRRRIGALERRIRHTDGR